MPLKWRKYSSFADARLDFWTRSCELTGGENLFVQVKPPKAYKHVIVAEPRMRLMQQCIDPAVTFSLQR